MPNFVPAAQFRSRGHFDFGSAFPVVRHLKNWHGSGAAPPPWFSISISPMALLSTGLQETPSPFHHGSSTQTTHPSLSNSQLPPATETSGLQDTLTSPSGPSRLLILSAGSLNRCPGCGAGLTLSQAELTFLGVKCDCWQTGRRVVPTAQTPARRKFGCGLSRSR